MTEFIEVLNKQHYKTGKIKARADVHKDGDYHQAVHVWIVNDKNEILLQKRSSTKENNPNKFDVSCAGHLDPGENSITAAIREIKEELGINIQCSDLQFIGTSVQNIITLNKEGRYINNEFNDVYMLRSSLDLDKLKLQTSEVAGVVYVPIAEFRQMIKKQDKNLVMRNNAEFNMLFNALELEL